MSLGIPILNTLAAWDSTKGTTFTFNVDSGDQVVSNTLVIRRNSDNVVVYNQNQVTYKFEHIVAPNASSTLINGGYYNAYLTTKNSDGDTSVNSNVIQFYCYTTPTFNFLNFPASSIIGNSYYTFQIGYNQSENELLNSYVATLYDSSKNILSTSGKIYVSQMTSLPLTLTYKVEGLIDNNRYFIAVQGETVNGTQLNIPETLFTVRYFTPNVYSKLYAVNNCDGGYTTLSTNVVLIEGTSNPSPPIYVNHDAVDLTSVGSWVEWSQGYESTEDFTLKFWFNKMNLDTVFAVIKNSLNNNIVLKSNKISNNFYISLSVDGLYNIYSSSITYSTINNYCLQVRRVNNLYDLILEVV